MPEFGQLLVADEVVLRQEGETQQHVGVLVLPLFLQHLQLRRLVHQIVRQCGGVADGAGHHGADRVGVRAQDAHDLHGSAHIGGVKEEVQSGLGPAHIAVAAG